MLRESQEQECRVRVLPRGVELRQVRWLLQTHSQRHRWTLDEEARQERLKIVGRVFFFFFEIP